MPRRKKKKIPRGDAATSMAIQRRYEITQEMLGKVPKGYYRKRRKAAKGKSKS